MARVHCNSISTIILFLAGKKINLRLEKKNVALDVTTKLIQTVCTFQNQKGGKYYF